MMWRFLIVVRVASLLLTGCTTSTVNTSAPLAALEQSASSREEFLREEIEADFEQFTDAIERVYFGFVLAEQTKLAQWNSLKEATRDKIAASEVWTAETAAVELFGPILRFFEDANLRIQYSREGVPRRLSFNRPFRAFVTVKESDDSLIRNASCEVPKGVSVLQDEAVAQPSGRIRMRPILLSMSPVNPLNCSGGRQTLKIALREMRAGALNQYQLSSGNTLFKISSFESTSAASQKFLLESKKQSRSSKFVFDLSGNLGGDFRVFALALANLGFGEDLAFPTLFERRGHELATTESGAVSLGPPSHKKAIVVVDARCAGACEWAALESRRRADLLLVGSNTSGRSSLVQPSRLVMTHTKIAFDIPTSVMSTSNKVTDTIPHYGVLPEIWLDGNAPSRP